MDSGILITALFGKLRYKLNMKAPLTFN